ncbi:MAG: hypothetical protein JSS81_25450 [Acidobacteria bacterium]|nr:hypothetical protein [Acidobacteriota bacterium]
MNVSKSIMRNLDRAVLAFAVCLLTLTPAFALTNGQHRLFSGNELNALAKPTAVFNSCWIDYNVTESGVKGMRIHVNFEVTGLKGIDSKLVARVRNADGDYLMNEGSSYSNDSGELETSFEMKPGYPTTVYKDADMFLPYNEINIGKGVWNLELDIDVSYADGTLIQHLTFKEFEFTQNRGNTTPEPSTKLDATVKRVWIDYNVTEGGRKGMRVHVNFEVSGLKGVDSMLVARVQKENGDFVTSRSPSFSNGDGELEISFSMKPGYATTVYEDAQMFLPYNELTLRRGVWNLKFDIDLKYENGEFIKHLDYEEFEFTQP